MSMKPGDSISPMASIRRRARRRAGRRPRDAAIPDADVRRHRRVPLPSTTDPPVISTLRRRRWRRAGTPDEQEQGDYKSPPMLKVTGQRIIVQP